MLIVRAAFDLLRSQKFHESVKRRLQIKLANINVPSYVTPLRLQGLNLGNVPPMIKSAYSLPSPSPTLLPRLVMHVTYSGRCSLVVQTNVDLKDASGLVGLEKTPEDFLLTQAVSSVSAAGSGAMHSREREVREQVSSLSMHSNASVSSAGSAASTSSKRSGVVRSYQSLKNIMSGGVH
jgi:hypothetical protein